MFFVNFVLKFFFRVVFDKIVVDVGINIKLCYFVYVVCDGLLMMLLGN